MKQSDFQFTDPHIEKIDFRINNEKTISDDLPISIEIESKTHLEYKEATVKLNLVVGKINQNNEVITSLYFKGIIAADFRWNNEMKSLDKMLEVNGGTVLLSYIRPILATLTMQAGLKPLNLPFVNFTE